MVNQDNSFVPGLGNIGAKSLKKSNRYPMEAVYVEQDKYGFIEFEPFSYECENYHLCVRTRMTTYT